MAGLGYLVSGLSPESIEVRRAQQNQEALLQAREALIGYALQYREKNPAASMYGYLPLPDLGTTRNNNAGCGGWKAAMPPTSPETHSIRR